MKSNVTPDIKNDIGVYVVQNNDTKETYVGSGVLGLRKNTHSRLLDSNAHWNSNLQEAYNRNPNFEFIGVSLKGDTSVKEQREDALALEQLLIDENSGNPLLLNKCMRVGNTMTGFKHTPEANKQTSQRAIVRWEDEEIRNKTIAAQNKGKSEMTDEQKLIRSVRLSEFQTKRYAALPHSPLLGQKRTEDFCKANSEKIKAKWSDPEYRKKQQDIKDAKEYSFAQKVSVDGVVFTSTEKAARATGVSRATVTNRSNSNKFPSWNFIKEN